MKRLLTIIFALFITLTAAAQAEKSIVIDQSSFRPVQKDALTGVNIDPIELDNSKRPCARLKVKINRMTRDEINAIEVKIITNNHLTKNKTAEYDNGLILEMTAKSNTRFYFHHDEFGDSNEVCLNLEADKEYYLEAYLNQSFSIIVNSNVAGADVYLDNIFKGQTSDAHSITIQEVMIGDHDLRLEYGNTPYNQKITVTKSNISFRQDVNSQASKPQFVVFAVEPKSAVVMIDGKLYTPQDGVVTAVLGSGTYNYTVSAKDHHDSNGTFSVAGAKVEKIVTLAPAYGWLEVNAESLKGAAVFVDNELIGTAPIKSGALASGEHNIRIVKELYNAHTATVTISDNKTTTYNPSLSADFATVTLIAPDGAEIWINGEKKGSSSYTSRLSTGAYIFEARKAGHSSGTLSQTITATPAKQSYTLPAPTPITGGVTVTSSPAMADVAVDGTIVGRTPITLDNILVGEHTITVSKDGYSKFSQSITMAKGKSIEIDAQLVKGTVGPYKVGDFYDSNGRKGVVTTVDATGYKGTIALLPQSATQADAKPYKVGDIVEVDGVKGVVFQVNTDGYSGKIVSMTQSPSKLIWSKNSGKKLGINNAKDGASNMAKISTLSNFPAFEWCKNLGNSWYLPAKDELTAIYKNKVAIDKRMSVKLGYNTYWSSTEYGPYVAYTVGMKSGRTAYYDGECYKSSAKYYVRAVAKFGKSRAFDATADIPKTSGPYKAGDFYHENGKVGVVLTVDKCGRNGTLVSLVDGGCNLEDSETSGKEWYMPSISTLEDIAVKKYKWLNYALSKHGEPIGPHLYICYPAQWRSINGIGDRDSYRWVYDCVENHKRTTIALRKGEKANLPQNAKWRAISNFGDGYTQGPYEVGDYYRENGKEGVVFEVTTDGMHGKIVNINTNEKEGWQPAKSKLKFVGATNNQDGRKNMEIIRQQEGWQSLYPAFAYCAKLGSDWYLPAIYEVEKIVKIKESFNAYSEYPLRNNYEFIISSTEIDKKTYNTWYYRGSSTSRSYQEDKRKYSGNRVLPVANF